MKNRDQWRKGADGFALGLVRNEEDEVSKYSCVLHLC